MHLTDYGIHAVYICTNSGAQTEFPCATKAAQTRRPSSGDRLLTKLYPAVSNIPLLKRQQNTLCPSLKSCYILISIYVSSLLCYLIFDREFSISEYCQAFPPSSPLKSDLTL